ncbi:MAG: hypothetical protein JRN29_04910, partial [Nitrososphaerota archaeon]|nr:hypothetical protein [Nitrososphaerota archaeon]
MNRKYDVLAKKVLSESLRVKKGESVTIETWNSGLPFALSVSAEAKRMGAIPLLTFEDEKTFVEVAKTVPAENLGGMGGHEYALLSETDAYVFIPGPPIATYTKLTKEQKDGSTAYNASWYEAAAKAGLRGVRMSFGYVGDHMARLLGKKKSAIVDRLLDAALCDYGSIRKKALSVAERMGDGTTVTLSSGRERLELTLKGE